MGLALFSGIEHTNILHYIIVILEVI